MINITQAQIDKTIKECPFRADLEGVIMCGGTIDFCEDTIKRGMCDAMTELFKSERSECNENEV